MTAIQKSIAWIAVLSICLVLPACGGGGGGATPAPPPVNRAPQPQDLSTATNPGVALDGTLTATDPDGDTIAFAIVSNPTNGGLSVSGTGNRDFTYTPNGGFSGTDSFTFKANDGTIDSITATVTIEVNNKPVVTGSSYSTSDIGVVTGLIVAADAEGDATTFSLSAQPSKGTVSSFDTSTGEFIYTPDAVQDGIDSFAVTANDGYQMSEQATIDIEIFRWMGTKQFGGTGNDTPALGSLLVNDDGSILVGGITDASFDGTPNAGGRDSWLHKVDRRGNDLWSKQFGDATDTALRFLFANPLDDGFYGITNTDKADVYRFDKDGNEIWKVTVNLGTNDSINPGYAAVVDGLGNIYVAFPIQTPSYGAGGFAIARLAASDGSEFWQREYFSSFDQPTDPFIVGSTNIRIRGMVIDSFGRPIVVGHYAPDPNGSTATCTVCPFVANLESDGSSRWISEPVFPDNECKATTPLYRVAVADDDSIFVTGWPSTQDEGLGARTAKLSADGSTVLWSTCRSEVAAAIYPFTAPVPYGDGGVIILTSNRIYENTSYSDVISMNAEASHYDQNGSLVWRRPILGTKADGSVATSSAGHIATDKQGVVFVTLSTDGETAGVPSAGGMDTSLQRLGADGSLQ